VREISPISDPASRTYAARITLAGELDGVALGMTAVVQALRTSEPVFVLPLSALQSRDGVPRVWRVDPASSTVESVQVTTAGLLDDAVRISGGLRPGDRIVTAGANLLLPKQPVRVLDDPLAPPQPAPTATPAGAQATGSAR
jgi:multidrug efflux pump subunit AcrA (membrane-fusion protein)